MNRHARIRKGSSIVEFTLVGIPLIFFLISTIELARGMWVYHTMAYAIKEAARYAVVHGMNCDPTGPQANSCLTSVGRIAQHIQYHGVGLDPSSLRITMAAYGPPPSATPITGSQVAEFKLSDCIESCVIDPNDPSVCPPTKCTTTWPAAPWYVPPGTTLQVSGVIEFRSVLCFFWPGRGNVQFGTFYFPSTSREMLQF